MNKIKWWIFLGLILTGLIGSPLHSAETVKGDKKMTVAEGKTIGIEYTLKLKDDSVIDTNVGAEPLTYIQGSHQIIPGLEKELEGMKVGEIKKVTVNPKDGYGEINEKAVVEVNKELIPKDVKVGMQLQGRNADGQAISATIKEIKEKTVLLDHNHPLAGKTLFFDVKILSID